MYQPFWYLFAKNRIVLAEFQHIDGSARWLTNFDYNHTPHAGTLPSTGHY